MRAEKQEVCHRLRYVEGHLGGIRKMVEEEKYCVEVLHQTHAVRKALEKLEALLLESHLRTCVPEGITAGNEGAIVQELLQLYHVETSC